MPRTRTTRWWISGWHKTGIHHESFPEPTEFSLLKATLQSSGNLKPAIKYLENTQAKEDLKSDACISKPLGVRLKLRFPSRAHRWESFSKGSVAFKLKKKKKQLPKGPSMTIAARRRPMFSIRADMFLQLEACIPQRSLTNSVKRDGQ